MDIDIYKEKGKFNVIASKLTPTEIARLIIELENISEDKNMKTTSKLLEGIRNEFHRQVEEGIKRLKKE